MVLVSRCGQAWLRIADGWAVDADPAANEDQHADL